MKFNGTVIIIDPCYAARSNDDWQRCAWGADMSALGFTRFLYMDVSGDGTKKFTDKSTGESLGSCCTDSSVLVALYFDELMRYDLSFREHILRPQNVMLLRDFVGEIEFDEASRTITGSGSIGFTSD